MDLLCDMVLIENILIDYLDFVLLVFGLGLKMGLDVINKWLVEILCEWGCLIKMDEEVCVCVDVIWDEFVIFSDKEMKC